MKNQAGLKKWLIALSVVLIAIVCVMYINQKRSQQVRISYISFLEMLQNGQLKSVNLTDNPVMYFETFENGSVVYVTDNPRTENLKEYLLLHGVQVTEKSAAGGYTTLISASILGIALLICYRLAKSRPGREMIAIEADNYNNQEHKPATFEDIAGNDEAKDNIKDLVDFIQQPEKYQKYGARIPRGVIFYGAPGTGKTLMAKAIAGEAGVPFYAVSGSDFVQMYVGVGAARVRDLFDKARKQGKAVIFIDEIDAIGKKRALSPSGGSDEKDQTLNALLTEMSGFKESEGIIVIAATNRLDILDEALLRPGRFDRMEEIRLPDLKGRLSILALYAKSKPICNTVSLEQLAKQTVYFSGAMLENLLNEAAINAAKRNARFIETEDVDKAYFTIIAGTEKKDRSGIREQERKVTAFHEAGHALVTKKSAPANTVSKVTIIPSSKGAGGFSVNIPPDKLFYTKKELKSQIMVSLAGRAAEEIVFGPESVTTGASNDIEKATSILKDYMLKYGMCDESGLVNTNILFEGQFFEHTQILDKSKEIMLQLYAETKNIIMEHYDKLCVIAQWLLDKESLNEQELDLLIE